MPRSHSPQICTVAAVLLTAGLSLAACSRAINPMGTGGSSSPVPASPRVSSSASAGTASRPLAPLTGLPTASVAAAGRPAVALDLAGPDPSGLASADVVFQEFSSPVRYVAVFQSEQATAGPVTGTQPADKQALSVIHPLLGYNGAAAPSFITSLHKSKVVKDAGYAGHPSLYMTGTQGISASTKAITNAITGQAAPPPLFRYRGASSGADTLAATGVSRPTSAHVTIPGYGTEYWAFSPQHDSWELTRGGPRVRVANVVVQTVSYKSIGINRRAGLSAQVAQVIGSGRAEVLSGGATGGNGGTAASGIWSKPHINDVTIYLQTSGSLMAFQPGPTWIILAPPGTNVSTSG
jgi:Protein of unknown function (DUF3048) C-terminal domain